MAIYFSKGRGGPVGVSITTSSGSDFFLPFFFFFFFFFLGGNGGISWIITGLTSALDSVKSNKYLTTGSSSISSTYNDSSETLSSFFSTFTGCWYPLLLLVSTTSSSSSSEDTYSECESG